MESLLIHFLSWFYDSKCLEVKGKGFSKRKLHTLCMDFGALHNRMVLLRFLAGFCKSLISLIQFVDCSFWSRDLDVWMTRLNENEYF